MVHQSQPENKPDELDEVACVAEVTGVAEYRLAVEPRRVSGDC